MEPEAPYNNKPKFSAGARFQSFTYAWKGMIKVFRIEHNMWIHLAIAIAVVATGFYFCISSLEWIAVTLAIGMVIAAELVNSAIEKLVDFVSPGYSEHAGLVKDIAAGAVLVCAIAAAVIGVIIFGPRIW